MGDYMVKQVAKLSGVSVRTLHHYHEIGLLKPARVGANRYRYYGRDELLWLQQILFHRELGFALDEIRKVSPASGFTCRLYYRYNPQRERPITCSPLLCSSREESHVISRPRLVSR